MQERMTIDMTPTWAETIEMCLMALEHGTETGKSAARIDQRRLAVMVDQANAAAKADA